MENVSIVTKVDVEELLMKDGPSNLENVVKIVNEFLELGLKSPKSTTTLDDKMVLGAISRCCNSIGPRFWVLDRPIIDDDQYAISLALIENGIPVLGVLGCPNYSSSPANKGSILYARKGSGAWMQPLLLPHAHQILFGMSENQIQIKASSIQNPALARTTCLGLRYVILISYIISKWS